MENCSCYMSRSVNIYVKWKDRSKNGALVRVQVPCLALSNENEPWKDSFFLSPLSLPSCRLFSPSLLNIEGSAFK
jgi:hypothetical protein